MKTTLITSKPPYFGNYIKEIYRFRGLIWSLVKRDLKAKYVQTKLGYLWVYFQPLAILLIFSLLFDHFLNINTNQVPYLVFAFSGMFIWYLFVGIVVNSGLGLLNTSELVKNMYFPRYCILLAKTLFSLIESIATFSILLIMLLYFNLFSLNFLLAIGPILLLTIFSGLAVGTWLSTFTVAQRDLIHAVPFLVNMGVWVTPVFYPISVVPPQYQGLLLILNPLAGLIEFFRSILFGYPLSFNLLLGSLFFIVFWISGFYLFVKIDGRITEKL